MMATSKEKPTLSGLELGLKTAATLVITTVSLTYIVLNTLFIAPLKEERDSLRKERNSLLDICREYLRQQNTALSPPPDGPQQPIITSNPARDRLLQAANALIALGNKIEEMPPAEQQSEAAFSDWRARSVAFLSALDQREGTRFEAQFAALTDSEPATYQLMRQRTTDGLLVLQAAKGKILNPKR